MTAAKTLFCVSRPIRLRIEGFTTARYDDPWSTLVEDEQRDRPNSQTYLDHQDKDKRFNYLKRHMAHQNEAYLIKNNKVSAATLSARLLWGATTNLNKNVEILNKNLTY